MHLQPRGRLVDEVDRLVGQEAVGDVTVRERRGRDDRAVVDAHAVVLLVLVLQAAQDRDRVFDARLGDEHGLEAPRQRRILLDMLLVLVECGRADAVQLAARERGLQEVGRVHRAVGLAGADQRVHLVDEQHDAAVRGRHLVQHSLQPLLELAAVFRARDQCAHVEREQLLVLQALRHVAVHNAQRETFHDGSLADARLADQHRIVLGAAREHLNGAADFLIAPDHRIELAVARGLRQIARVFLQRIIGLFGICRIRRAALAQRLDRGVQILRGDAGAGQDLAGLAVLLDREREQEPLDGDERVSRLLAGFLRGVEHPRERWLQIELPCPAFDLGTFGERSLDGAQRLARIAAGAVDQPAGQALPGRRAGLSADGRGRIAGDPREGPKIARIARSRGRGPCISRCSFNTSLGLFQPPRRRAPDHRHWVALPHQ